MNPLSLDALRELAPGFVMGTLSDEELAAFTAALRDPVVAAELAPELAAHRAAAEFLATERAVTPPPSLRERVAQRIAEEQQSPLRSAVTVELPVPTPSSTASATPRAVRVTPTMSPAMRRRRSSTPAWVTAGVFALAAAASLVLVFNLRGRLEALEYELSMQQRVAQQTARDLAAKDSVVRALTEGERDLELVRLAANVTEGPSLQLFWNRRAGTAVVTASGLAPIAKDRAYCLWVIRNGKPEAVALFTPDTNGKRLLNSVAVPKDAENIAAFAVTEEPAAGSPQPTMTPFLVGAVNATR